MKKFCLTLAILMGAAISAYALDKTVTFEWDAYTGEQATLIDGGSVKLFQRTLPNGTYDYNAPIATVQQEIEAGTGNSTPVRTDVTLTFPDGENTTYGFVARGSNANGDSADSDEVTLRVDLSTLPAVTDLTATFDRQTDTINFTWTQNQPDRVLSWKLYRADTSGGPYTELETIDWDGTSTTLTATQSIVPPAGESVTYYFVVVAFADHGINSGDSNEVMITVDRRPAPKVINLKVTIQ